MSDKNVIKGDVIARDTVHFTNGLRMHVELEGLNEAMADDAMTDFKLAFTYDPRTKSLMLVERSIQCSADSPLFECISPEAKAK